MPDAPRVITKATVRSLHVDGTAAVPSSEPVLVEHELKVHIAGRLVVQLVCTATALEELVVGRLFGAGLIARASDIQSVAFNATRTEAQVTLSAEAPSLVAAGAPVVPSATAGTRVFAEARDKAPLPERVAPIPWRPADVFALARVFLSDSPMHRRTSGVHSCYLTRGARVLCRCEDIGRHNAFDKVIGYGLIHGIDLHRCAVFSSGRLPWDMVSKAVRAGIPLVMSKSVTTDRAIELAQESDLTLIGSAWPESFCVYNDPIGCSAPEEEGGVPRIVRICA